MRKRIFLKNLLLGLVFILTFCFSGRMVSLAQLLQKNFLPDNAQKLNQLINYALEKGKILEGEGENNLVYLEKKEKIAENKEKRLYWTFHFIIFLNPNSWQAQIVVFQADCIVEEWELEKDKYIITQKIIIDGRADRFDGQADVFFERKIIETLNGTVLEIIDLPQSSVEERQRLFDFYLDEMLKEMPKI